MTKRVPMRAMCAGVGLAWLSAAMAPGAETVREQLQRLDQRVYFSETTALMGVRVFESSRGTRWELQFWDSNYKNDERLIVFIGDKLAADQTGVVPPFELGLLKSLTPQDVDLPLSALRSKVADLARQAKAKPVRWRYILISPKDGKPSWRVSALNAVGDPIGHIVFDAQSGELISSAWGSAARAQVAQDDKGPKRGLGKLGEDMEKTFKGIGGDLESFFTGRRTIDR